MKIVFASNYFSHHQKPLCDHLAALSEFAFLQTQPMEQERLDLGWNNQRPDYVTEDASVLEQADVVIAGSAPEKWIRPCILQGKLVYRYHERPLKDGNPLWKRAVRRIKWHWQNPAKANVWLLCAGGSVAADYETFGLFRGRALKWGYFPESGTPAQKETGTILWAGRLLRWKHPEKAVAVAAQLKAAGYAFTMDIIGIGSMEQTLRQQIDREQLADSVRLCGAMPPEAVREKMGRSAIFLFTSDKQEGWGAVLNEAMSSGCAVVASGEAGATAYLVRHGKNGLCYDENADLYQQTASFLAHGDMQKAFGLAAQETIAELWNGAVAAERLVAFSQQILAGETPEFWPEGPCSQG